MTLPEQQAVNRVIDGIRSFGFFEIITAEDAKAALSIVKSTRDKDLVIERREDEGWMIVSKSIREGVKMMVFKDEFGIK